jgi:hypothetical protein
VGGQQCNKIVSERKRKIEERNKLRKNMAESKSVEKSSAADENVQSEGE